VKQEHESVGQREDGYAWYALSVLVLVYALNFIDRQILSILAEDIKADLQLTDAQLGFLYGTAFAIFYALFGIPLGRLADDWYRGRLVSLGLVVWSAMTAVSGLATNFFQIAAARIGVGIGEAAASPAAFSMLADYFSSRRRALAMSIYSAGLYIGMGLSLPIGGWIADSWNAAYADGGAPFGLTGWRVAFLAVGLPGLLLAAWVLSLREPLRGATDGVGAHPARSDAWRRFGSELAAIIPPLTLIRASRNPGGLSRNLAGAALIAAAAAVLWFATGDAAQWIGYGIGIYAVFSWIQTLRYTDPPTFALIWGNRTTLLAIAAFGSLSFFTYGYMFWVAPYAIRTFEIAKDAAGLYIGLPAAIASAAGVIAGGRISDAWKLRDPRGRVFVCMLSPATSIPLAVVMFSVDGFAAYAVLCAVIYFLNSLWLGSAIAAYQDLVLPRMRGTIGATYLLAATMLGLALGPDFVGKVATVSDSLHTGMFALVAIAPFPLFLLWFLSGRIGEAEATKFERAAQAGEQLA
jgi:MFS family permease